MTGKRWTWRRVAEDNQAQLNKALEILQATEAENKRLKNEVVRLDDLIASGPNYVDEIGRLRALVADIRRLHDSPLHQSFAGSCDGCEALAEFDEQQSRGGATRTDADPQAPKTGHE